jgi:tRNA pseudouridine13 synthase
VRGSDVELQDDDLRLKYLGRTKEALSARNITSNRFSVTIRDLTVGEIAQLPSAVAEVNRLGMVNYFDSQRFGSLKHGQGFIAKDLLRGDFEAALKNFMAKPSPLDRTNDAKVKAHWRDHWGDWRKRCTIEGADRYEQILVSLRHDPKDFRTAILRIDAKYRAMQIFTYQSWIWNECVRRLLMAILPGQSLLALNYQAGKLLFPRELTPELAHRLRTQTLPLLAPDSKIEDPDIKRAVEWVLGREKISLDKLRVPDAPEIFFKHEERPVMVFPGKLMVGPPRPDEENQGRKKIYVAFTLPPGSYATLVVRRLFHFTEQSNAEADALEAEAEQKARGRKGRDRDRDEKGEPTNDPLAPPPAPEPAPEPRLGFRARAQLKKQARAKFRADAPPEPAPKLKRPKRS